MFCQPAPSLYSSSNQNWDIIRLQSDQPVNKPQAFLALPHLSFCPLSRISEGLVDLSRVQVLLFIIPEDTTIVTDYSFSCSMPVCGLQLMVVSGETGSVLFLISQACPCTVCESSPLSVHIGILSIFKSLSSLDRLSLGLCFKGTMENQKIWHHGTPHLAWVGIRRTNCHFICKLLFIDWTSKWRAYLLWCCYFSYILYLRMICILFCKCGFIKH